MQQLIPLDALAKLQNYTDEKFGHKQEAKLFRIKDL